jgi:DUF1680 family protein
VRAPLPVGGELALRVDTRYPWEGEVRLTLEEAPEREAALHLRVPAWAAGATLGVNGERAEARVARGYATLRRRWRSGDTVLLTLPMPVRRVRAHPRVLADEGRVALARGPLVYCLEGDDHPGLDVWEMLLPPEAPLIAEEAPELLGGVVVLRSRGEVAETPDGALYRPAAGEPARHPAQITAIPYYAWANRQPGPMLVWMREG